MEEILKKLSRLTSTSYLIFWLEPYRGSVAQETPGFHKPNANRHNSEKLELLTGSSSQGLASKMRLMFHFLRKQRQLPPVASSWCQLQPEAESVDKIKLVWTDEQQKQTFIKKEDLKSIRKRLSKWRCVREREKKCEKARERITPLKRKRQKWVGRMIEMVGKKLF